MWRQRELPVETGGGDWGGDPAPSQGISEATRSWKGQERTLPYRFQREHSPAHTLTLDSRPKPLNFCCLSHPVWGTM